ncbi:membrane-spanning 4-domains subfamily A member 4A-like isoform X1 [Pimephales promelas]|uniref:membrane-spanning 4-domains subfamily A member 4A-like isoform X1 n=2 Tax=Pimephales promelas TaxID=90988 RepID=UPI001955E573|nr:membrane-spanning 4-domains subfamily A member 4A-like isoform X1 [Pimephales promelas]
MLVILQSLENQKHFTETEKTVTPRAVPEMDTGEVKDTVIRLKVTQGNIISVDGQETEGQYLNAVLLKGFLKLQPKALGTVQVMIGVVVFFLGVLLTLNDYNYPAILVYSGITYWGSCIFIIAGSLSVAAQDKRHPSVVKASLGMNVFSAVTAGLAIPLMSVQLAVISMMDPSLYAEYFSLRIVGIMLVFTVPQFIISICVSAFACKASCNTHSTLVNVALNQGH